MKIVCKYFHEIPHSSPALTVGKVLTKLCES